LHRALQIAESVERLFFGGKPFPSEMRVRVRKREKEKRLIEIVGDIFEFNLERKFLIWKHLNCKQLLSINKKQQVKDLLSLLDEFNERIRLKKRWRMWMEEEASVAD
jgi:hypothetical protein